MPTEAEKVTMSLERAHRLPTNKLKKGKESYENLKRKRYPQELQRARDKKMKREVEREKQAKAKAIEDNVDVDKSSEAEETDEEKKAEKDEKKKEDEEKEKRKQDRKRKMEGLLYLLFNLQFCDFWFFLIHLEVHN